MSAIEYRVTQVLLALDAASHNPETLESAVELATRLQAGLLGLFVEDDELLRMAGLPFSREVTLGTASERSLSSEVMRRTLRAQAAQTQAALARIAARAQVAWQFRILQGKRVQCALEQAGPSDVLILGRSRRGEWLSPNRAHTLYVILEDVPESAHALALAGHLIDERLREVVILDRTSPAAPLTALEAAAQLAASGAEVRVFDLHDQPLERLKVQVLHRPAATVIVPAGSPLMAEALEALRERVKCPVLVVR